MHWFAYIKYSKPTNQNLRNQNLRNQNLRNQNLRNQNLLVGVVGAVKGVDGVAEGQVEEGGAVAETHLLLVGVEVEEQQHVGVEVSGEVGEVETHHQPHLLLVGLVVEEQHVGEHEGERVGEVERVGGVGEVVWQYRMKKKGKPLMKKKRTNQTQLHEVGPHEEHEDGVHVVVDEDEDGGGMRLLRVQPHHLLPPPRRCCTCSRRGRCCPSGSGSRCVAPFFYTTHRRPCNECHGCRQPPQKLPALQRPYECN